MKTAATTISGAWLAGDDTTVSFRDAAVAWALAAHGVLAETATGYGHFITVEELAERVQEMSGVRTDAPTRTWMDAILRKVARRCHSAGEPPLTALCVRANHTVGDSYKYVLELAGLPTPEDLELHAAYARWQCYQTYGAEVPADGGVPPLTPKVAARRGVAKARKVEPEPEPVAAPAVCPQCFIQLPATGICQYC
ncbi:hypothetical protein [Nocardia macrotermitis]|uniref:Uncharacterized protein n=1 Tax=Nocardia macrotermitis TaxID=2585198 RepID=A0A7K0D7X2_9NOCA|nr:hypothetical protein [Nocardia macrotermitis]MQY21883.1 hypothetical protein [Nocardia macrotermitis]